MLLLLCGFAVALVWGVALHAADLCVCVCVCVVCRTWLLCYRAQIIVCDARRTAIASSSVVVIGRCRRRLVNCATIHSTIMLYSSDVSVVSR